MAMDMGQMPQQTPYQNNLRRVRPPRTSRFVNLTSNIPLNEAVKIELASAEPAKTPVSILQELLSRRGLAPKYELLQIEGAIHEPIFRYRVTLENVVAVGSGHSKKDAKHNAAKNLLDTLAGNTPAMENIPTNGATIEPTSFAEKAAGNPIGLLQEMCMSRRWPPPTYETESEEGLPHERVFKITCQIFKMRETGEGKSKKVAKRQAAYKMWGVLQDTPLDDVQEEIEITKSGKAISRYATLKDSKIKTLSTQHSHKVSQFHKTLKNSNGKNLAELQKTPLNNKLFNYVQFLQEIASEQQFEVTYVDIEERSISGKCQCLVQLSTLPVAVCYGTGTNSKDAQASAAQNALEYLKIMTKK